MKRILITGANSYVGTSFDHWIAKWPDSYHVDTIDMKNESWRNESFKSYDVIFHVAGIAHSDINKASKETQEMYYKVNRDLAVETANKAKEDGVKQFIFMSSIIVYGDSGEKKAITKDTLPQPSNFYGDSKLQAENGLLPLQTDDFNIVIVRPPMIYGNNSKGNFKRLAKLALKTPIFPSIKNQRSILYIDNLCEFIRKLIDNHESGLFYPQNTEYVSTSDMVRTIADVHGRKIIFVSIFNPILKIVGKYMKSINKIFGNLIYDKSMSSYTDNYNTKDFYESILETEKKNKKKICIVHTISKTMDWFITYLLKYLHDDEYEIFLICNMDKEFIEKNSKYATCINISMKRGMSFTNSLMSIKKLHHIFKKEKFDIIQYSTPNASLYAAIAGKLAHVPVRLYCQWGLRYESMSGIKRSIFKSIEKITCKLSNWIEPDSQGNLMLCQREGLYKKENSSVIWNGSACGVDLNKFDISRKNIWRNEIRNKYEIRDDEFVYGFVGRVDRDKGFNELIESFQNISKKDMRLLIIGMEDKVDTVDHNLYTYSKTIESIIYTGMVNDVEKYMAAMDCLVLPSYREGFGSVVIEAEAMEVPVIVTNIPGPTEAMINDHTGLVVEKKNIDDLEKALLRLYMNRELAVTYGKNGRKFVEDNFDQKIIINKILEDRNRLIDLFEKK